MSTACLLKLRPVDDRMSILHQEQKILGIITGCDAGGISGELHAALSAISPLPF